MPGPDPAGAPGDAYVVVTSAPDPRFRPARTRAQAQRGDRRRRGRARAALEVPTLDGPSRLGGGARGDLYVLIGVLIPRDLSDEEPARWGRLHSGDRRRGQPKDAGRVAGAVRDGASGVYSQSDRSRRFAVGIHETSNSRGRTICLVPTGFLVRPGAPGRSRGSALPGAAVLAGVGGSSAGRLSTFSNASRHSEGPKVPVWSPLVCQISSWSGCPTPGGPLRAPWSS